MHIDEENISNQFLKRKKNTEKKFNNNDDIQLNNKFNSCDWHMR